MITHQEGDIVLCTVVNIDGTSVFVKLEDGQQGTITTSEIAPGRIRNIREYVIPNKKIVCKVLRVLKDHLDLSLRRVTSKERTQILEQFKQEQTAKSALNSLLKEKSEEIQLKIKENFKTLSEFFLAAKEDESLVVKYIPKEAVDAILKIVQKRKKGIEIKKLVKMKCLAPDGIKKIKEIFAENDENMEITYISAGNFQIKIKDEDYKKANQKMSAFLEIVEKKGKANSCEYSIEDK